MGVTGLWTLVEPAGKPVALESLENKILAVGNLNFFMSFKVIFSLNRHFHLAQSIN